MVGGKGDVGDYQARASIAAAELESPEPEKLASGRLNIHNTTPSGMTCICRERDAR